MKLSEYVINAIDAVEEGKFKLALLLACCAVDGSAKRLYPSSGTGVRYKKFLRNNYWLIEPMIGVGLNLNETKFSFIKPSHDFADIIYEQFRCNQAHGSDIPDIFTFSESKDHVTHWEFSKDSFVMPDRVIWALLASVVFSKVNQSENSKGDYEFWFSNPNQRISFPIANSWGKEDEVKSFFEQMNKVRVTLCDLKDFN